MAKNALQALDDLDWLGEDSLLFISDEADDRAELGRGNGLGPATSTAVAAFGLEVAAEAPVETPGAPDLSDLPDTGPFLSFEIGGALGTPGGNGTDGSMITLIDAVFAARGGGGGGGGKNKPKGDPDGPTATYVSGAVDTDSKDNYNIQIDFYGDSAIWTGTYSDGETYDFGEAFIAAANFLSSIIAVGANDVKDMRGNLVYDDLVIDVYIVDIADPDVIGRGGPTGVRATDRLTATGIIEIDIDFAVTYLRSGLLDDVVFHEMMHVLGFGTLWDLNDLLDTTSIQVGGAETKKPTDDVYKTTIIYTGDEANAAAEDAEVVYPLVVEQDGGSGTAGGHWDELWIDADGNEHYDGGYDNEIMTGFIDETNYLSAFSVASLVDIGYTLVSSDDGPADYALLASSLSTDSLSADIVLNSDLGFADYLLA